MTSLVLPAYNPGPDVERAWRSVADFVADRCRRGDPWEALFVLDGCTDGTPDRLERLAEQTGDPRVRVLAYAPNRGKGFAVRTGLAAARGSVRVFTDVDLAYSLEDVQRVAQTVRDGAAVAIASRAHPESRLELPAPALGYAYRRAIQGKVFGAIARLLLGLPQRDTQAGLKGLTASAAETLLPHLTCDGFGFDCELLTACARAGLPVVEVPVCVRYDSGTSTTSWKSGLRMIRELWHIRKVWRRKTVAVAPTSAPAPPVQAEPAHRAAA